MQYLLESRKGIKEYMKSLSIEYGHIYTNQLVGPEQAACVPVVSELHRGLTAAGSHTVSLAVMVDDYSSPNPEFRYESYKKWLGEKGIEPDVYIRESQLIPQCDAVIAQIVDNRLRGKLVDYVQRKRYPCSLFIASWYLARLGCMPTPLVPEEERAWKLINVLSESFQEPESKALKIIEATSFRDKLNQIEYRFLPSTGINLDHES